MMQRHVLEVGLDEESLLVQEIGEMITEDVGNLVTNLILWLFLAWFVRCLQSSSQKNLRMKVREERQGHKVDISVYLGMV